MPYTYYEHVSDIGIRAEGETLEEAFDSGVSATLAVMFDLDTVGAGVEAEVAADAPELDLLFVEVINEVLSLMGREELALKGMKGSHVKKNEKTGGYEFTGTAFGEKFDMDRIVVETEVKGATYSGLEYSRGPGGEHVFTCILDV